MERHSRTGRPRRPGAQERGARTRAIRTDRGNPVEIEDVICGTLVRVRLVYGGGTLALDTSDLRADGGRAEIDAALTRVAGVDGDE